MTRWTSWLREVAVLACIIASTWPLAQLINGTSHTMTIVLSAALVGLAGIVVRALRGQLFAALVAGVGAIVVSLAWNVSRFGGSPSPSGLKQIFSSAGRQISTSVAPLPSTPSVIIVVALGAALVALVVDYVAGHSRMPILAALPIAAPFVVVATALGHTLAVAPFVAAAFSWVALAWATFSPRDTTDGGFNAALLRAGAVAVSAAIAVWAALGLADAVPHRATPALSKNPAQAVDTSVNFSETLDLSKDLNSRNSAPVLIYTTDAKVPEPIRVTVSSQYRGGQWLASTREESTVTARNSFRLDPPGYEEGKVPTTIQNFGVLVNGMDAPLVGSPSPIYATNFGQANASFQLTANSRVPLLRVKPEQYATQFRQFTKDSKPTSNARVTTATPSVTVADLSLGDLPVAAQQRVRALAADATAGQTTAFDKAAAIQRAFRTDPSYRYSLTLAPRRVVDGQPLDPLSNFLETKQGYCVQFASAMVMMARAEGIPARIAIGFLPGTVNAAKRYEVRASDAHAWVELFFPGMGWTRFDPTPSSRSGVAPAYAPDESATQPSPSSAAAATTTSPRSSSTSKSSTPSSTTSATQPTKKDPGSLLTRVLKALGIAALLVGALCLLPVAGRRERDRLSRQASNRGEAAEGLWHELAWRLRDLGMPLARGRSPRAVVEAFGAAHPDLANVIVPLARAAATLEEGRYAPAATRSSLPSIEPVVHAAQASAPWYVKVRAALFPASGFAFFGRLFGRDIQP